MNSIDSSFKAKYGNIIKIAIPASLEMVLQQILGLIDNAFISHISDEKLAAVGLCNHIYSLILIIVAAVASGTGIIVAQCYGKKDMTAIKKIINTVMFIGIMAATILIVFFRLSINAIVTFMGAEEIVIMYVNKYWSIVVYSLLFSVIISFLGSILRAMNNTKLPLIANFLGLLTNVVLNYIMLFVLDFDLFGVAVATIISRFLIVMIMLMNYKKK